jgi:hypothetical protein
MSLLIYCSQKHKAADRLYSTRRHSLILSFLGPNDSRLKNLQWELLHTKISKLHTKIHYEKTISKWLPMLRGKSPTLQKRRSNPRPISTHAKATWTSEVLLDNQIPPFIKPYQGPIHSKFHSNYPIINLETGFSLIITTNH